MNHGMVDQLRHERDRFVAFAFASADILVELDEDGNILFADGATRGLLGRPAADMQGLNFYDMLSAEDAQSMRKVMESLGNTYRMEDIELTLHSTHNDKMPFAVSGFRLSSLRNHTYLSLSILKGNVTTDQLFKRDFDTGLLRQQGYVEAANEKILEAKSQGKSLKITLLDFPELKAFIDQLDDEAANKLLREISDYIRGKSLDGDTAGMINAESYSFVHDGSIEPAQMIQDIIIITQKADPTGKGIEVRSQTIKADPGALTKQDSANALLYTLNQFANHAGEGFSIDSLSSGYAKMLDETVMKMAAFKETVNEEDFKLAFQPIVDLKSGLIHHYEVLVRINNNEKFSNPFDFITFGEQAGIIGDFDLLMCQKVFDVLIRTAKQGNRPMVAVNISGKSLGSLLFKDALRKLLDTNKKLRKQVIFEVTESAKIEDMRDANDFLQELRGEGNLCCLDDFGTGESSFEYLRNLQVDFIKIDGSYVRESLQTPRGRHMLKAMAGLCRDLNVTTIGEMVEDEKAASLLWDAGVKFGQGYLFGKPEVDEQTIIHCKKPTPFYQGIMRAKRFDKKDRAWWSAAN